MPQAQRRTQIFLASLLLAASPGLRAQRGGTSSRTIQPPANAARNQPKPPKPEPLTAAPEMQMTARVFAPGFRFTSERDLIEVPVIVRDRNGIAVANLKSGDFQIFDNGKPVAVGLFESEVRPPAAPPLAPGAPALTTRAVAATAASARPRSIALLFDDLNISNVDVFYARKAATDYVQKGWRPGDRMAVLTTSEIASLDFTDDRDAVIKAIAAIVPHSEITGGAPATTVAARSATSAIHAGGNSDEMLEVQSQHTMDGIRDAVAYTARQPAGDKTVVLASDGFPTYFPANGANLEHEMDLLVAAALHTQVVVNSIDVAGLSTDPGSFARWQTMTDVLNEVSEDTGGAFYENGNALGAAFETLGSGPDVSYMLGFSPVGLKDDGAHHDLKVKLANPQGETVQARAGYYAPLKVGTGSVAADLEVNLDKALKGTAFTQLPATLSVEHGAFTDGTTGINVVVHLDTKALPYQKAEGRYLERVRYVAVLFDASGKYVMGQEGVMTLNLGDATHNKLATEGLNTGLALPAPVGTYQLQVIVQEGAKGMTTSLTQPGVNVTQ